ncbi:MAG: immunoglobulin domain-containing protein [Verrucomicrobia bacterium]|nr:immunoglobulin domain-containing protein [Verrucomicrobiota bacterium]
MNEALTHTDPSPGDAIELFNSSASAANIGGWFLTDAFGTPNKFRIPDGTSIPAGGYIVFYQSNSFGLGTNGFALSSKGDDLHLFSADASGNLTGWTHGFSFGPQANGVSFGRHVDSTGDDHFVAQSAVTLGTANAGPVVTVAISEINYHPPDIQGLRENFDNNTDEYIELHNTGAQAAPLYDPANPVNTWKLRDAVSYTFPPGVVIPAGGFVLVVGFNPSDAATLAAFRLVNGVPESTPIYGPWSGQLDNSANNVELVRPDLPDAPGTPTAGFVSFIMVDKIDYKDALPWPVGLPDGLGAVIGRVDVRAFGNDPANWRAAPKTPGAPLPTGGVAPVITVQPASVVGVEGTTVSLTLVASGEGLGYIWTQNGRPVSDAPSSPTLTFTSLRDSQLGTYACYVFNSSGAAVSSNATVGIRYLPRITLQPVSRAVYIKPDTKAANLPNGTNVTFTVGASTFEPPLNYQWRFNGVDIPGATTTSLLVTNVALENEGDYDCVVTDGVGSVNTTPARLAPWVSPAIVQRPSDMTVAAGSDFSLSVEVTGNPMPFAYSWRRNLGSIVVNTNSGPYKTNFVTLNTETALLRLTNGMQSSNFVMRIVVYNDANKAPGATATFNVTVLEDTDRDGIPDSVENALGLDTNNVADAAGDLDLDGMSNRAEYIAGTDPANNQSYLKIEQSVTPGSSSVQFGGISNRTYTVQFTDSLNANTWSSLADLSARSTNFTQQLADPSWTTNRFYRVVTPRQ